MADTYGADLAESVPDNVGRRYPRPSDWRSWRCDERHGFRYVDELKPALQGAQYWG